MQIDDLDTDLLDAAADCHQLREHIITLASLLQHSLDSPNLTLNPSKPLQRVGRPAVQRHCTGIGVFEALRCQFAFGHSFVQSLWG